jgi:hypothetical protein
MPLVRLQDGPSQWGDIKDAAHMLWRTSYIPDVNALRAEMQIHYQTSVIQTADLHTGFNATRRAVLICNETKVTIAFQGTGDGELHMNTWCVLLDLSSPTCMINSAWFPLFFQSCMVC